MFVDYCHYDDAPFFFLTFVKYQMPSNDDVSVSLHPKQCVSRPAATVWKNMPTLILLPRLCAYSPTPVLALRHPLQYKNRCHQTDKRTVSFCRCDKLSHPLFHRSISRLLNSSNVPSKGSTLPLRISSSPFCKELVKLKLSAHPAKNGGTHDDGIFASVYRNKYRLARFPAISWKSRCNGLEGLSKA